MKIALGTVQFGLDYGVSNTKGKTAPDEVQRILQLAKISGIDTLDTAYHYGESEVTLGRFKELSQDFRVITKTRIFGNRQITVGDVEALDKAFEESLNRLQREAVDGLLIHQVENLFLEDGERLYRRLVDYRQANRTTKIGVSLYEPGQATRLLDHFDVDIVQIPLNLMDQRMLTSGMLDRFKSLSLEVHVRSAFLQGLFFMSPERIPKHLAQSRPYIAAIQERAKSYGVSVGALALGFLRGIPLIDRIVIGVNSSKQLLANLEDYRLVQGSLTYESLACEDTNIIDPRHWMMQQ